jgi:hypothetical protein
MPRFLSGEWAEQFNAALVGVALPEPDPDAGLAAADGHFTVAQEVRGAPGGDVRLLLRADGTALAISVEPLTAVEPEGEVQAGVTIALGYEDAAALARGDLTAAEALNDGRVRVRGDLSILVAGQRLFAAAQRGVAGRLTTTY